MRRVDAFSNDIYGVVLLEIKIDDTFNFILDLFVLLIGVYNISI